MYSIFYYPILLAKLGFKDLEMKNLKFTLLVYRSKIYN